jgi:hypothetical protein
MVARSPIGSRRTRGRDPSNHAVALRHRVDQRLQLEVLDERLSGGRALVVERDVAVPLGAAAGLMREPASAFGARRR